jgi:hypothetical protein
MHPSTMLRCNKCDRHPIQTNSGPRSESRQGRHRNGSAVSRDLKKEIVHFSLVCASIPGSLPAEQLK